MPTYLTTTLHYDAEHGPLLTLPILVLVAFLVPAIGWVSDHVGRRPVLFSAAVSTIVLSVPAFRLMEHGAVWSTLLGLGLLAYPVAVYVGNLAASLPAIFPTASRYGGMGISYNIAVAVFGGTAAFIMEALVKATGNSLAPAYWLIATSSAAFVAIFKLRETARRPLPGSMPAVTGYYTAPNEQILSFPFNSSTTVFFYNKDAFKAAGLDADKPPKTWPKVKEAAQKLKAAGHKCPLTTYFSLQC